MGSTLHPYDGIERTFRHDDGNRARTLPLIQQLLGMPAAPREDGLRYELSFYSGGIGAQDSHAIALPADPAWLDGTLRALNVATPEEAAADNAWGEHFLWLVGDDDAPLPVRDAAARFINENRRDFQPECSASDRLWFQRQSGVNSWLALWETRGIVSALIFDQG